MSAPPGNPPLEPLEQAKPTHCPRCNAATDGAQEYCLECGLRLPRPEGLPGRLGVAWQRRLRWYPGDWLWPVLGLGALAALGAAAAILTTNDDAPQAAPTVVLTTSVISTAVTTVPTAPTTPTVPEPTVPTTPPPTVTVPQPKPRPKPKPKPKPKPGKANALTVWPAAHNGYTIVLASVPKPSGRAAALAQARGAQNAGLRRVGVLDSDRFSSLHPGYYVVFSGIYGSYSQANAQLERARNAGFGIPYPRLVTR